jgi:uncharacterized protein YbjT (DUF2867 family)
MPAGSGGRVLVTGATGLVGGECVRRFATHPAFGRVVAVVRRELPAALRLPAVEARVADFEALERLDDVGPVSHVLCALGTTIRQAGSQERFRRVDHDYAIATARLGLRLGAHHFLLVSALGASAGSRVFYNRVKGETEDGVRALGYGSTTVVRPSLLLGDRAERRFGEEVAKRFGFLMPGRLRPVDAADVADALVAAAAEDRRGERVIESDEIRRMARR